MANINGTNGNDQISGTNKNDVILAYAGNDVIDGGAGDDSINAGEGNNRVDGGSGNDTITAGAGNDVIDGGSGNDVINAGNGNNTVDGGSGNDTITTGSGNDVIEGDSGNDVISAGAGNDIVEGGEGNDRISGGEGNDQLYGDAGDDIIEGGSGDDFIDGGTGQDRLYGGEGNDTILGSSASDLIHGGAGNDIIGRDDDWWRYGRGESGSDIIYGDGLNYATDSAAAMAFGSDIIYSGNGNDTIYGDSGNNLSGSGAGGNDKIFAGRGDDKVYGEGGNDLIYGEDGDDLLDGGAGDDSIKGGDGRDTVYGGLGNDFISGADGRDLLYGGSGNDRIGNNDDSNWRHGYFSENGGDTIYGDGKDSAAGAAAAMGNDVIFSGLGNDTLYGDNGNNLNGAGAGGADTLYAGSGNDTVYGEGGDDELFGESGNDNLYGGAGADEIAGGLGIDTLSGGAGADTFVFTAALNQQDQHGQHGNGYPHNFGHHRGYDHDGQWSWSDSTGSAMDTVTDFKGINDTANLAEQDKIDLVQLLGDGVDLKWGGTTPTANGVWFKQLGGDTYVYADIGGNTTAELAIRLSGIHNLVAADFLGVTIPNSTPVLGDTNNPAAVAELANASAQNLSPISGNFTVTDMDVGNTLTPSIVGSPVVMLNGAAFVLPASANALIAAGAFSLIGATSNGGLVNIGYTYDPAAAHLDFLAAGQSLTITYTIKVSDGTVDSGTQDVIFTITGTNDAAVLSGATVNLTETNAVLNAGGTLTISDVDSAALFVAQAGTVGLYGSFSINPAGAWTYTASTAHDEFVAGTTYTDTFSVTSADGTLSAVTVTILGTNDIPVIGGVSAGAVTEDATSPNLTISGALTISDLDVDQASFVSQAGTLGSNGYGTFSVSAAGNWTYSAANGQIAIQALGAGDSLTDSFIVTSFDGSSSQVVTITLQGTNDDPVLSVDTSGAVTEDAATPTLTDSGVLSFTDVDTTNTHTVSVSNNADAVWSGGAL
ncbi:VCBS domain-containing protein, partial [Aeromonas aquatica]|uniref:VCBS domain-containing protein n=1 Tax=Aeromonas aquatica TaxID=558964 RepID=UPI001930DA25